MTDEEAYELMVKYGGGKRGMTMINEMLHLVGIEGAFNNINISFVNREKKEMPEDFKAWMIQALTHAYRKLAENKN